MALYRLFLKADKLQDQRQRHKNNSVGAILQWSDSDPYGYNIHSTSPLESHGPMALVQAATGSALPRARALHKLQIVMAALDSDLTQRGKPVCTWTAQSSCWTNIVSTLLLLGIHSLNILSISHSSKH
jgi:hypothetical protein